VSPVRRRSDVGAGPRMWQTHLRWGRPGRSFLGQLIFLMPPKKSSGPGCDLKTCKRYLANPLWPLEELRDLGDPPFVADPEFTRFDIDAFRTQDRRFSAPTLACRSERLRSYPREFPIPPSVSGLPWRCAQPITLPVVPDAEFAPLQLSYLQAN
jgi:hypothetical protein